MLSMVWPDIICGRCQYGPAISFLLMSLSASHARSLITTETKKKKYMFQKLSVHHWKARNASDADISVIFPKFFFLCLLGF